MTFIEPSLPSIATPEPAVPTVTVRQHQRRVSGRTSSPLSRSSDPETSHQAKPHDPDRTERLIVALLAERGAMTSDEIAAAIPDIYHGTLTSARGRLHRAGLVCDSGARRPSARNRLQAVWQLTEYGQQEAMR